MTAPFTVACDGCGVTVRSHEAHRFERPDRTPIASFCDACCPRCAAPRQAAML